MSESENKPETYQIVGAWNVLHPDTRQYKQQSVEITFQGLGVAVDVPASLVVNASETSLVLSLEGMKYVQDQFEKLFAETLADESWSKSAGLTHTDVDEWFVEKNATVVGDEWDTTDETKAVDQWDSKTDLETAQDDGWEDSDVFSETEPTNKPDSEVWNESDEDWK